MPQSSAFMVSLAMTGLSIGAEAPKVLDFKISSATNPGGQGGYTGTVHMERAKTTEPFKVTWKLSDGTTQKGWGVPFPKTGYIAVAYGGTVWLFHHSIQTLGDPGTGEGTTGDDLLIYKSNYEKVMAYVKSLEIAGSADVISPFKFFLGYEK